MSWFGFNVSTQTAAQVSDGPVVPNEINSKNFSRTSQPSRLIAGFLISLSNQSLGLMVLSA